MCHYTNKDRNIIFSSTFTSHKNEKLTARKTHNPTSRLIALLRYGRPWLYSRATRRIKSGTWRQHADRAQHGSLAVHRAVSQRRSEMGTHDAHDLRSSGSVGGPSAKVAVSRGHLRGRRHSPSVAGRDEEIR